VKINEVPQDESILEGLRRACYAQDDRGEYKVVASRGWEVERIVNTQATSALARALKEVLKEVRAGRLSPLAYHMASRQMDVPLLAANAKLCRWRVRRHLKPAVFARLSDALKARYAHALALSVADLSRTPGHTS